MTRRVVFAVLVGGMVGAGFGGLEAIVQLIACRQVIPWRIAMAVVAVGMAMSAVFCGMLSLAWAWLARRAAPRVFRPQMVALSALAMVWSLGGFYVSAWWLPTLKSHVSVALLSVWTLAWWTAVWAILRRAPHRVAAPAEPLSLRGVTFAAGATALLAAGCFLSARLHRTARPAPSSQDVRHHPDKPNVVLIVMDTTRADHLSCYGYPRPTTPSVDRVASEGVLFEQAMATAPWTMPSHATLFTGLYTAQHRAERSHQRLDDQWTTLAEVMKAHGYQTVGFSNNAWVSRATNFRQGFEHLDDFKGVWRVWRLANRLALPQAIRRVRQEHLHNDRPGGSGDINRRVREWFSAHRDATRPVFLFINYLDAHFPYVPPEPYRSRFLRPAHAEIARRFSSRKAQEDLDLTAPPIHIDAEVWGALSDLYDGEVSYVDANIGELLEDLRQRGQLDNAIVVITADHGEHLGEHNLFTHRFSVYEDVLHVPLIFWSPRRIHAGVRMAEPVSLVSVFPTLLKLADIEEPVLTAGLPGRSLLGSPSSAPSDQAMLAEYEGPADLLRRFKRFKPKQPIDARYFNRDLKTLRQASWKFIVASDGSQELYDLSRDAHETDNLITREPERGRAMEQQLHALLDTYKPISGPERVPQLDAETLQSLRSLGYVQ